MKYTVEWVERIRHYVEVDAYSQANAIDVALQEDDLFQYCTEYEETIEDSVTAYPTSNDDNGAFQRWVDDGSPIDPA